MGLRLVAVVAIVGSMNAGGCRQPGAVDPVTGNHSSATAESWDGREVHVPATPPEWFVWESGDGVRLAAPAHLDQQAVPGTLILRAVHGSTRYQVSLPTDSGQVTGPFQPAEVFEAFMDNFASSGGFRRDGPTERLRVGGQPAAQARFVDGDLRAVARVVRRGNSIVSLVVVNDGSVDEANPAVGGFLNSLQIDGRP